MLATRTACASILVCALAGAAQSQSSDILSHSEFGASVAVTGNRIFVGEPANLRIPGRVYVFEKDVTTDQWIHVGQFSAEDGKPGDGFGTSLAASGTLLVVGEVGEDTGRIHVYRRGPVGHWTPIATLDGSELGTTGTLGDAVATDGERVFASIANVAGIQVAQLDLDTDSGAWRIAHKLHVAHFAQWDGDRASKRVSLSVSGNMLLVGDATTLGGRVFAYRNQAGSWSQADSLAGGSGLRLGGSDHRLAGAVLGSSVSIVGNNALLGMPEDSEGAGSVIVLAADTLNGGWRFGAPLDTLSAKLLEDNAAFGSAVAANRQLAVVGASRDYFEYGAAFVYQRERADEPWSLVQALRPEIGESYPSVTGGEVKCEDGTAAGFSCKNVDIASFLSISSLGLEPGMQTNDAWGWTDPDTGKEYAIVCSLHSTTFVDVTDPFNPVVLGNLPATPGTRANWWRDAKTYSHYAYIVADNVGDHGLQIFDLNQLRDVTDPPVTFEPTARYDGFDSAHNIIIDEDTGTAYVVGINGGGRTCGGGSHILDLADPLHPKFLGCFAHPGTNHEQEGATHDAQCVVYHGPDERYQGHEICIASNVDAISIADFTDKEQIQPIAIARYPNSSYTHQGWLTEDHRYFYQNDETDEINGLTDGTRTLIWDFAELDDPVLLNEYVSANQATDHNYFVSGHYLYQSNYVSGLRILDISDAENPVEVGFFDTVPWGKDEPGYGGSWSNYPFFKSGTIVVTSMEEGVFFLKRAEVAP